MMAKVFKSEVTSSATQFFKIRRNPGLQTSWDALPDHCKVVWSLYFPKILLAIVLMWSLIFADFLIKAVLRLHGSLTTRFSK